MEPFPSSRPFRRHLSRTSLERKPWPARTDWFCCCPRAVQDSQEQQMDQTYPSHLHTWIQRPETSQVPLSWDTACLDPAWGCLTAISSWNLSDQYKITAQSLIFPQNLLFPCYRKDGGVPRLSLPILAAILDSTSLLRWFSCLNLATSLRNSLETWLWEWRDLWSELFILWSAPITPGVRCQWRLCHSSASPWVQWPLMDDGGTRGEGTVLFHLGVGGEQQCQ